MIYLVYSSKATHPFSSKELTDLLRRSCENNAQNGVTGLLLYKHGQFMQLLEGQEKAVHRCFEKICADSRHSEIIKLIEKPIRTRHFAGWSMAFQNLEQLSGEELSDGFSSFLDGPFDSQDLGKTIDEGIFLLLSFKKQMLTYYSDDA